MHFKPILAILGGAIVCFLIFGAFFVFHTRQLVVDAEIARLDALANAHADELELLIDSYRERTGLIASRTLLRKLIADTKSSPADAEQTEITKILRDAMDTSSTIQSISVLAAGSGSVTSSTDTELIGMDRSEIARKLGIQQNKAGNAAVRYAIKDKAVDLIVVSPMILNNKRIADILVRFRPDAIIRQIGNVAFSETGEIVLGASDAAGNARFVTTVRKKAAPMGSRLADAGDFRVPMIHALNGRNSVLIESAFDYDNTPVIAVTRHIPELGWGLIAKIDRAEVMGRLFADQIEFISVGGVFALVFLACSSAVGKRLSAELSSRERAERQFSLLFSAAPTPMLIVDASGCVTMSNRKAQELLQYDAETLVGLSVETLVPDSVRAQHKAKREAYSVQVATEKMGLLRGLYTRRRDGKTVPVEIGLVPIDAEDGNMIIVALVDVTEREETKRILELRAEELERSNRELDEFAYVASHDLRAPLRGIDQLAAFVEEDAGDILPEQAQSDLGLLRGRVGRMEALLNSLLEYSRVGRTESAPDWIEIPAMLNEIAEMYVPTDRFKVHIPADAPPIFAPRTAVEIVFRNLLMNAVKHHDHDEGEIRVAWSSDAGGLHFTVTDDGPGIPEEFFDKVFQLFQTLKPRDRVEGSGMGLAMIKKTLSVQGGEIAIESGAGRGTTFRVTWPHHRPNEGIAA